MDDTQLLVQMLQQNASALGIRWQLRPATVTGVTSASTVVNIRVDGDADNGIIHGMTLVGPLAVGVRVMCLIIPHEIIYVIGVLSTATRYEIGDTIEYLGNDTFNDTNYPGIRAAKMMGMGAGGGGGFGGSAAAGAASAGGGGGGGGYSEVIVPVETLGGLDWTITVPAGGAGGTSAAINGGTAGPFTVVNGSTTLLSAEGGVGGESVGGTAGVAIAAGGTGGTPSVGDFLIKGSDGGNGFHGTNFAVPGVGGAGAMWGNVRAPSSADAGGNGLNAPANSGSGGSGGGDQPGSTTARNGGAGGSGRGRITLLY